MALLLLSIATPPENCVSYETDTIRVTGVIREGSGKDRLYVHLADSVCVGSGRHIYEFGERGITRMQLVGDSATVGRLRAYRGQSVTLIGEVFTPWTSQADTPVAFGVRTVCTRTCTTLPEWTGRLTPGCFELHPRRPLRPRVDHESPPEFRLTFPDSVGPPNDSVARSWFWTQHRLIRQWYHSSPMTTTVLFGSGFDLVDLTLTAAGDSILGLSELSTDVVSNRTDTVSVAGHRVPCRGSP